MAKSNSSSSSYSPGLSPSGLILRQTLFHFTIASTNLLPQITTTASFQQQVPRQHQVSVDKCALSRVQSVAQRKLVSALFLLHD